MWNVTKGRYGDEYPAGMGSYSYGYAYAKIEPEFDCKVNGILYCVTISLSAKCTFSHEAWGDDEWFDDVNFVVGKVEKYVGDHEVETVYQNSKYDKDEGNQFIETEFGKALGEVIEQEIEKGRFDEDLLESANEE